MDISLTLAFICYGILLLGFSYSLVKDICYFARQPKSPLGSTEQVENALLQGAILNILANADNPLTTDEIQDNISPWVDGQTLRTNLLLLRQRGQIKYWVTKDEQLMWELR